MEEVFGDDKMVDDVLGDLSSDFEPSCFHTEFNGLVDPCYANVANTNSSDPLTLSQAIKRPDWDRWEEAIQSELTALAAFDTFEVVDLPPGKQPVGCKYVFKIKYRPDGTVDKYEVRLVAQGFLQQEGVDYTEIFALVVDSTSISLLLVIANQEEWEIEQMDVVTAFLHGRLEEEVYMRIPPFMKVENATNKLLKMRCIVWFETGQPCMGENV